MEYQDRHIEKDVSEALEWSPCVAILGPRQCGKTFMARHLLGGRENTLYLDLERPSDLAKLDDAEWFLSQQRGKLVCIDEVQRKPDLFPLLRSLVDEWGGSGHFLLLGSASRDLIRQSSETLAGRVVFKRLSPFLYKELPGTVSLQDYLVRGGFPRSLLASNKVSAAWCESFISTFLERDLLLWSGFTPVTMQRLWKMLAHLNGQTANFSSLASSLGVSAPTVRNYIDLLAETFMLDIVPPYFSNMGKRLVKAPKVYVADSALTLSMLGVRSYDELISHPVLGSLWEQVVLTNLKGLFPDAEFFYYRTNNGTEMDFVMKRGERVTAIECKASLSPTLSVGTYNAIKDIQPDETWVVAPVDKGWPVTKGVDVVALHELESKAG